MAHVASFTEIGGDHRENEDAFAVRRHPGDERLLLAVLADGMGGQHGGGPAARLACQAALDAAAGTHASNLRDSFHWLAVLRAADEAVRDDDEAGYTTLIGFATDGLTVCGASCG